MLYAPQQQPDVFDGLLSQINLIADAPFKGCSAQGHDKAPGQRLGIRGT